MIVTIKELAEMVKNIRKVGKKWYLAKPENGGVNFFHRLRAAGIVLLNRGVVVEWR